MADRITRLACGCVHDAVLDGYLGGTGIIGFCATHGPDHASTVYVDDDPTPRSGWRTDLYGLHVVGVGQLPNARVNSVPPD